MQLHLTLTADRPQPGAIRQADGERYALLRCRGDLYGAS